MNPFDKNLQENFNGSQFDNVILFHGYGADAHDLSGLSNMIPTEKKFNWYFPNGLLEVPIGPGWTGRAWWNISLDRYQQSEFDISNEVPENLSVLRTQFQKWLELKKMDTSKTIIGGFSQGGMLATDLFIHLKGNFKGLALLSTSLINKNELSTKLKDLINKPQFFQSHGMSDPVLPINGANKLESLLRGSGLKGQFFQFKGGHEIPQNVLVELGSYLNKI